MGQLVVHEVHAQTARAWLPGWRWRDRSERAIESFDTAPAPSSSPASPPSVGETGSHEDARVLRHEPVAVPSIDRHLNDQRPTVKPITITAAASLPTAATYCRRGLD